MSTPGWHAMFDGRYVVVERRSELGPCWEFTGARQRDPYTGLPSYGVVSLNGRRPTAHRASWALATECDLGSIRNHVAHACDNRPCIRPDHLSQMTPSQNSRDMAAKGRGGIHDGAKRSRFRPSEVQAIRLLYADGYTLAALADLFDSRLTTIHAVVQRRSHASVPDAEVAA